MCGGVVGLRWRLSSVSLLFYNGYVLSARNTRTRAGELPARPPHCALSCSFAEFGAVSLIVGRCDACVGEPTPQPVGFA